MSEPAAPPTEEVTAAMMAANARGAQLRCGDYLDIEQDTYGHIEPCPFCKRSQDEYPAAWYNGPGSPPSYAIQCGECGAQGPTSHGTCRGDHYGALIDAVREWNRALPTSAVSQSGEAVQASSAQDEPIPNPLPNGSTGGGE